MDTRTSSPWRRIVASTTSALVLALSVLVPLLDGDRSFDGPVLEAERHGSSCVVVHDHTICIQIATNVALVPGPDEPRRLPGRVLEEGPSDPGAPIGTPLYGPHLPRAPPFHRA